MTKRPLIICALLSALFPGRSYAAEYRAERFDSRVEVLRGGTLRVTETLLLRFEGKSFSRVFREIPARFTDGIEFVSAAMDGRPLPPGSAPGQVEVKDTGRVRVTWHFAPLTNSSHVFTLTYVARGAVRQENDADVVAWQMLPSQHGYRIDSSSGIFELPAVPATAPALRGERTGSRTLSVEDRRVLVEGRDIRENGWMAAQIRLPPGSTIETAPVWQRHEREIHSHAATWLLVAGTMLGVGIVLLIAVRQAYDAPPAGPNATWSSPALPEALAPAIAGALVTNGMVRLEHALAALFALAERGELMFEEQPRSWGHRNFAMSRRVTGAPLSGHEQAALDIVLNARDGAETTVGLTTARRRLVRQFRAFRAALHRDIAALDLIDEDRRVVRTRFTRLGIGAMLTAAMMGLGFVGLVDDFGAWPMLTPAALLIIGVAALICSTAYTPLSNAGIRRAENWRAFRKYLGRVARDREPSPGEETVRQWLPYAIAVGSAQGWAHYLKRHRGAAPPWFRALAGTDSAPAFAAFVGMGGAATGSGAPGGGAAGGGSSGAG